MISQLTWKLDEGTPVIMFESIAPVLDDYFNGKGKETPHDLRGIPFITPRPQFILDAIRETGYRGKIEITLNIQDVKVI